MKLDRRGDIGFMEAMAGAMTVCLALMSFTAYVAADAVSTYDEPPGFDESLLNSIQFENGSVIIPEDEFITFLEDTCYRGISVNVRLIGSNVSMQWGEKTDICTTERFLISFSDEDQLLPAAVEVVLSL